MANAKDKLSRATVIALATWFGLWGCMYLGYWGEWTATVSSFTLFLGYFCGLTDGRNGVGTLKGGV